MDHAACRQIGRNGRAGDRSGAGQQTNSKGRAGDVACIRPTDGQRQGRRWIMQHAGRWTGAGQEMDNAAFMPADGQGQGRR